MQTLRLQRSAQLLPRRLGLPRAAATAWPTCQVAPRGRASELNVAVCRQRMRMQRGGAQRRLPCQRRSLRRPSAGPAALALSAGMPAIPAPCSQRGGTGGSRQPRGQGGVPDGALHGQQRIAPVDEVEPERRPPVCRWAGGGRGQAYDCRFAMGAAPAWPAPWEYLRPGIILLLFWPPPPLSWPCAC